MNDWWEGIYAGFYGCQSKQEVLARIAGLAADLGFDYTCYGLCYTVPCSSQYNGAVLVLDSYPVTWMPHYSKQSYLLEDPVVERGLSSFEPIPWCGALFEAAQSLWHDARGVGLRIGISQSCWGVHGSYGLLSLARSATPLTNIEIDYLSPRIRWAADRVMCQLERLLGVGEAFSPQQAMSGREKQVLDWTTRGKTAWETGQILGISENTVNYHIKNLLRKLNAQRKTEVAAAALTSGWLLGPLQATFESHHCEAEPFADCTLTQSCIQNR